MNTNENEVRLLNDLILINTARIEDYRKAMGRLKPEEYELKLILQEILNQSMEFNSELTQKLIETKSEVEREASTTNHIYRKWADVRTFVEGCDRSSFLDNCIKSEYAVGDAYKNAWHLPDLSAQTYLVIIKQHAILKSSLVSLKALKYA